MGFEHRISKLFRMSDEVWQRHTNPWSVWTRYLALPALVLAIWSRVTIGYAAWIPVLVVFFWIWINPRIFAKPKSTNNWASKAVLGERVWLNRKKVPIPEHFDRIIMVLNSINGLSTLVCLYGLVVLSPTATLVGLLGVVLGKSWFLDRMVWLYDVMREANPEYQGWLY